MILFCVVLYCIVLYCIVLYCVVLYCIVLCCIVLYCIVLYCIVLYCVVLYCIVLYCVVLYCIVLCCIVLYCFVLCCIILSYITFYYCVMLYKIYFSNLKFKHRINSKDILHFHSNSRQKWLVHRSKQGFFPLRSTCQSIRSPGAHYRLQQLFHRQLHLGGKQQREASECFLPPESHPCLLQTGCQRKDLRRFPGQFNRGPGCVQGCRALKTL